jgi:hypothetical protein
MRLALEPRPARLTPRARGGTRRGGKGEERDKEDEEGLMRDESEAKDTNFLIAGFCLAPAKGGCGACLSCVYG